MSMSVTAWVWEHGPRDPLLKFILLASAELDGCWFNENFAEHVSRKCGISEDFAWSSVESLLNDGWARLSTDRGRTIYHVCAAKPEAPEGIHAWSAIEGGAA